MLPLQNEQETEFFYRDSISSYTFYCKDTIFYLTLQDMEKKTTPLHKGNLASVFIVFFHPEGLGRTKNISDIKQV